MRNGHEPSDEQLAPIVERALAEDGAGNDITSRALVTPTLLGRAVIRADAEGVLAGMNVAQRVFHAVDPSLDVGARIPDGSPMRPGDVIADVSGRVISILTAERVALNFLQRLSGVATLTSRYVLETRGTGATLIDTRKTTPGLRLLEKYAVRMGGGRNHRLNLSDGVLIKDNHLVALRALGMTLEEIVATARENAPPGMQIEVETTSIEEAAEAALAGADIVMLDNMSPEDMRCAVSRLPAGVRTEASGGISLENLRSVAEAGVDLISVGALTHSARALDISLDLEPESLELS